MPVSLKMQTQLSSTGNCMNRVLSSGITPYSRVMLIHLRMFGADTCMVNQILSMIRDWDRGMSLVLQGTFI